MPRSARKSTDASGVILQCRTAAAVKVEEINAHFGFIIPRRCVLVNAVAEDERALPRSRRC